jgi:hypothetical protein
MLLLGISSQLDYKSLETRTVAYISPELSQSLALRVSPLKFTDNVDIVYYSVRFSSEATIVYICIQVL